MRKSLFVIALMTVSSVALAQGYQAKPGGAQSSNNPGGVQIQGNTAINANAENVGAVASGKGNTATNDVGTIGGK